MQRISAYRSLDMFRGFAALWVVMGHSCVPFVSRNPDYSSNPFYAFSLKGQLGVVIFFIISGYCITAAVYSALLSGKSLKRYFLERARRIYPPYLCSVALSVSVDLALGYALRHHWMPPINHAVALNTSPLYWIGNLLLMQKELHTPYVSVVFWSLCYEIAFYFVMGLFLLVAKRIAGSRGLGTATWFLISAIGLTTLASLIYLVVARKEVFPFDLWHLFAMGGLLFFLLECKALTSPGYSARMRRLISTNVLLNAAVLLYFTVYRQVGYVDASHPSSRVRGWTALAFCMLLTMLRQHDDAIIRSAITRPLIWLGTFSYSLYLVHPTVLPFVDVFLRHAGFDGQRYLATYGLEVITAVGAGWLMFLGTERYFLSKRQERRIVSEHPVSARTRYRTQHLFGWKTPRTTHIL